MKNLIGKKILFVAPRFYNYENMIIKELRNKGADVDFIPERKYGLLYSLLYKISYYLLCLYQKKYYLSKLKKKNRKYDILFVIRGCQMPIEFIEAFKFSNPYSLLLMYQWDSQKSNSYIHLRKYFDKVATFDYYDSKKYNIPYVPLFCVSNIMNKVDLHKERNIDFLYIASYRRERYELLKKIKPLLQKWNFAYVLYIPFLSFCVENLKGHKLNRSLVRFKPISFDNYVKMLLNSKVVIDVTPTNQTGLPIRIIEAIGADCKLLTTNENAVKEFSSNVFLLHERIDFDDLLSCKMIKRDNSKYSLGAWLDLFFI